ncbi:MAG: hypothetical protein ACREEJ_28165, partial [Ensifer adhaerens]
MKIRMSQMPLGVLTAMLQAVLLVVSVCIVYFGVMWIESDLEERFLAKLPRGAAQAYTDINAGRMP